MVRKRRKSRLPHSIQEALVRQFVAGTTARAAADLVGVNRHTATLYFRKLREIIERRVDAETPSLSGKIDSIVYTDGHTSYDVLDVSEFKHHRINHSEKFAEDKTNHINGIETFWNQAKRHMRRFNGIPKDLFPLFLKE